MAFFKRELSPVERFDAALKEKQAVRRKLADRLGLTEADFGLRRCARAGHRHDADDERQAQQCPFAT